ncbi:hypothetical protein [Brevibacillus parabrevis]|uniref:hypothetical protein n=1 Tax=Brevibacillus parabrevis TaxID=54914 RepID=UPI001F624D59|nr:hypothetical protein [Brevibacillus parabrevis]
MNRLDLISYVFPNKHAAEKEWCYYFSQLLKEVPHFREADQLRPLFSGSAMPATDFRTGDAAFPAIVFHSPKAFKLKVADLLISDRKSAGIKLASLNSLHAELPQTQEQSAGIDISQLYHQLKGRLTGVDHTGVNIPVTLMPRPEWDKFLATLSTVCNLYRYPDEDWPFIIPAEAEEHATNITDFSVKRTPKFELVYDSYTAKPLFQFALETNISREEMEALFPAPNGFAIPGLEEIFRCVAIKSPWDHGLGFRFDLYYKAEGEGLSDWETGEWLIKNGGRICG